MKKTKWVVSFLTVALVVGLVALAGSQLRRRRRATDHARTRLRRIRLTYTGELTTSCTSVGMPVLGQPVQDLPGPWMEAVDGRL